MVETFSNQASTMLSAAITTVTAATCNVIDATAFPATGNYRIIIDDEILIVTAVNGNIFTIFRGAENTIAVTHASGANVIHLLTKGSLEARVANRFLSDVYANKPAPGVKGRLFLPTDGLFLEYDDGAAWHQYGPYKRLKAPPQTGWSWVNQGNSTAIHTGSTLILEDPDLDAVNPQIRLYVRPIKQLPATVTMAYTCNGIGTSNAYMGFCMRESGGAQDGQFSTYGISISSSQATWMIRDNRYSSPTVQEDTGSWSTGRSLYAQQFIWWRFEMAGDKKRIYHSADGVNFIKLQDLDIYSANTPNQIGIFIDPTNNNQKVSMTLVHWEES
jgi:hypothetical protein